MPPTVEWLCSQYGWQGALMIHSAINANVIVSGTLFRPSKLEKQLLAEGKTPSNKTLHRSGSYQLVDLDGSARNKSSCVLGFGALKKINQYFAISDLIKSRLFIVYSLLSIFTIGAHIATTVFLVPRLVNDLGSSTRTASLLMTANGVAGTLARSLHGFLLDYKVISVTNLNLLSIIVCGINPLLNPFVTSLEGQFILAALSGVGGGVMAAMTVHVCRQYLPLDKTSNGIGLVLGLPAIGVFLLTQLMGKT